jgi:hypothetical protein
MRVLTGSFAIARASVIGFAFLAACSGKSANPAPAGPSPTPSRPNALRLEGPSSLAPGQTARYRVIAVFAGGSTQDVTTQSSLLASMNGHILLIGNDGAVTGDQPGEANLTAYYPAGVRSEDAINFAPGTLDSGPLHVLVLEPGTFRVSGVVTESGQPFGGIRVTVVSGRRAGLQVTTPPSGVYALYGLAGPTELAVSEEGLQPQVRSVVVTDHQVVDFALQPLPTYDSLTGNWRLVLSASPTCGSTLPAEAAVRTYQATIVQRGPQLTMEVSSHARVILDSYPSNALGGVSADGMTFRFQATNVEDRNPPLWALLEELEPGRFLGIGALGEGRRTGNRITGWLSGTFAIYRSAGGNYLGGPTVLETSCFRKIGEHEQIHSFSLDRN